jgi:hypothetical protein
MIYIKDIYTNQGYYENEDLDENEDVNIKQILLQLPSSIYESPENIIKKINIIKNFTHIKNSINHKYLISFRNNSSNLSLTYLYNRFFNNSLEKIHDIDDINSLDNIIFEPYIQNYIIYKINENSGNLIINIISRLSYNKINETIRYNLIVMSNILAYDKKYSETKYLESWKTLFNDWVEPIEPDDIDNYKKLLSIKINQETIQIDGSKFTDVLCYRNFIQKDFFANLRILYQNDKTDYDEIPILYTTYRTNEKKQVITILH